MVGIPLNRLDTPVLVADLDILEANLARMAAFFRGKPVGFRPHFKNHRVLALALRQIEAGAIGITCSRLWQVERLACVGIRSILLTNEIAGENPVRRLAELSRESMVMAVVDNPKVLDDMARIARDERIPLNVVVDIDLGLKRCGVPPGEAAAALAQRAVARGLRFRGVMGYEGHLQLLPPGLEKERAVRQALEALVGSKTLIEHLGIPVEIVSCGGTGDYAISGTYPGVTENQAGSFLLMDTGYAPFAPDFRPTLSVLATVVSKTEGERIVVDAGVKAISGERGLPSVKGIAGLRLRALHAEHAPIDLLDPNAPVEVGDKIELAVSYHDGTMHLHQQMYAVRKGIVEQVFTIEH
jgi:D-serine deaminase-like pyridoxal phosphate-dependent protein